MDDERNVVEKADISQKVKLSDVYKAGKEFTIPKTTSNLICIVTLNGPESKKTYDRKKLSADVIGKVDLIGYGDNPYVRIKVSDPTQLVKDFEIPEAVTLIAISYYLQSEMILDTQIKK